MLSEEERAKCLWKDRETICKFIADNAYKSWYGKTDEGKKIIDFAIQRLTSISEEEFDKLAEDYPEIRFERANWIVYGSEFDEYCIDDGDWGNEHTDYMMQNAEEGIAYSLAQALTHAFTDTIEEQGKEKYRIKYSSEFKFDPLA